jgi:hypothetical protein
MKKPIAIVEQDEILSQINQEWDKEIEPLSEELEKLAKQEHAIKQKSHEIAQVAWRKLEARLADMGLLKDYDEDKHYLSLKHGVITMKDKKDRNEPPEALKEIIRNIFNK